MSDVEQISVVIPSYRRGEILLDTLYALLNLPVLPCEILVVDQTEEHPTDVLEIFQWLETGADGFFNDWKKSMGKFQGLETGIVRRIELSKPSIPHAMNIGLQEAKRDIVLFLDDDIVPDENLIRAHLETHERFQEAKVVVGQVLQPEDVGEKAESRKAGNAEKLKTGKAEGRMRERGLFSAFQPFSISGFQAPVLRRHLRFAFNSSSPAWVENVMAGNLSVKKEFALRVGGFDENFIPPVSFRFETEFAKRLIAAGGKIRFAPEASIQHLRLSTGGTRSRGPHMASFSPSHGVGDYYYALRCGKGPDRILYMLRRPFREIRTRFHLRHPWYIPVKLIGEIRAIAVALRLYQRNPRLLSGDDTIDRDD